MTGDIVKWLNSGMDGNPSFVTDVLTYFQEVADEAAADFIYGEELGTVCKPFENDLRQNLSEAYKTTAYGGGEEKVACTIDDAGADVEAFVQGDFDAGGWSVWFETVLNPANTGTGVNSAALVVNHDRLAAANFAAKTETDWGRGVLSKKTCTVVGTGAFAKDVCTITTPGSIMQELGTKALGTGIEVIGVLYGNLAKEAVTGINGLLGLGGNAQFSNNTFGSGGNLSYLDAIKQESVNKKPGSGVNGNKIQQALATETKVLELQLAIVDTISTTTNFFASTSEPFIGKSCWDLTLPDALSTTLVQLSAKLPTTIGTVIALQDMVEEFASTTSAAGQLRLLEQLTGLQSQGLLSGQAAVVEYDYFLNSELKVFIADFKKKIIEEVKGCS
jgi:hypothetical protein